MADRVEAEWREQEDEMLQAFRIFDRDDNGFITQEELKDAMHASGYMLNDDQLSCMIKRADADGDGQINFRGQEQSLCLQKFVCMIFFTVCAEFLQMMREQ